MIRMNTPLIDQMAEFPTARHFFRIESSIGDAVGGDGRGPKNPLFFLLACVAVDLMVMGCGRETPEECLERGRRLVKKNERFAAIKAFSEAIRLRPNYADAYAERGLAESNTALPGPKRALEDFDRAIEIDRTNPSYYFSRGSLKFVDLYDNEGAIKDYSSALQYSLQNSGREGAMPHVFWARGRVHEKKGDLASAIADYQNVLKYAAPDWWSRPEVEAMLKKAQDMLK